MVHGRGLKMSLENSSALTEYCRGNERSTAMGGPDEALAWRSITHAR